MNKNILFIGANGYMGHGMSLNLLKQNNLYVIANKQRNNIENLIKEGAKEINSYARNKEFRFRLFNVMCHKYTNSHRNCK